MDLLGLFPVLISFVGNSLLEFSQCSLDELLQFHTGRNRSTQHPSETGTGPHSPLQEQEQVHTAPSRNRNRSTQHPPGTGTGPHSPLQEQEQVHKALLQEQEQHSAHGCELHRSPQQYVQEQHSVHRCDSTDPQSNMYRNSTELTDVSSPESTRLYTGTALSSRV